VVAGGVIEGGQVSRAWLRAMCSSRDSIHAWAAVWAAACQQTNLRFIANLLLTL
jgi:hypothetical protein